MFRYQYNAGGIFGTYHHICSAYADVHGALEGRLTHDGELFSRSKAERSQSLVQGLLGMNG